MHGQAPSGPCRWLTARPGVREAWDECVWAAAQQASGKRLLLVSRLAVLCFALFAGVWSIILIHIGIDINWLFFVIGLLVASVFPPISFLLTWNAVPKVTAAALLLPHATLPADTLPLNTPPSVLPHALHACLHAC